MVAATMQRHSSSRKSLTIKSEPAASAVDAAFPAGRERKFSKVAGKGAVNGAKPTADANGAGPSIPAEASNGDAADQSSQPSQPSQQPSQPSQQPPQWGSSQQSSGDALAVEQPSRQPQQPEPAAGKEKRRLSKAAKKGGKPLAEANGVGSSVSAEA
eukprot:6284367-Prymnesium_polylepis.1